MVSNSVDGCILHFTKIPNDIAFVSVSSPFSSFAGAICSDVTSSGSTGLNSLVKVATPAATEITTEEMLEQFLAEMLMSLTEIGGYLEMKLLAGEMKLQSLWWSGDEEFE
ncbi:hypothetical protein NE237_008707 [Protea cynaroides]|uniref:Uncharacterized protein n=1 Tax=Protea cynaroides TaxID=273540 RepID=A0A9Q0KWE2_9MAGN|nr:hypothetical protein NE237_008707 [Protea cynaroides]